MRIALGLFSALAFASTVVAGPIAYGVNGGGTLFYFDVDTPHLVTEVGNIGFTTAAIDFRPGTFELFGLVVGRVSAQLYSIDINTAVATPVGSGFAPSSSDGNGYDLGGTIGFDFNPSTLQVDDSMRIRVVSSNGANLRLNSSTGAIAMVDVPLSGTPSPNIDAVAYINNNPNMGTTATSLYALDFGNDQVSLINPPNNGTTSGVGSFGVSIDALQNIHFDIYTPNGASDVGVGDDIAYAVLQRTTTQNGAYLRYAVNLTTGAITNGMLVGPAQTPYDFTGGFALRPDAADVPEPGTWLLMSVGLLAVARLRRKR